MAHLRRNLNNSPPPMSPATTNAHNFYNTFAPRRGGAASPPPSIYPPSMSTQPSNVNLPPSRPASAMPSQSAANSNAFYQNTGSNYVNAQYYRDVNPQSPQLQPGYGSMDIGPDRQRGVAPPPPPPLTGIPPKSSAYVNRPIQSATYAPNHPSYGRPSPPPLNINNINGSYNSAGSAIRRPASAAGTTTRMPGAFPDDMIREQSPRNDLPLRNMNNANIVGIKAAARQRDQVLEQTEEEGEVPRSDSFWGDLFDKSQNPPIATVTLSHFLRGIAEYIITEFEPKSSIVITPPKMLAFYTKFKAPGGERLDWSNFFLGRPVKALSEVYQALNCHHHLVPPKDSSSSPPTVPSLTPQGFERWMTIQILSDPDLEAKRLITLLKQSPIQNPFERDPMLRRFPKTLSRESFPKFADGDTRRLWDLFVPDDEAVPAATPRATGNQVPGRSADQEQKEREQRERERERDQRVLEVLQDRDADNRSITPRGNAGGGYVPPPIIDDEPIPEHLRNDRGYESRPPPPIPNDNGIERERSPYSRTMPLRRDEVTRGDYDDEEYDQINHAFGYEAAKAPISSPRPAGPSVPPKTGPMSPPKRDDKRMSDFDREEEDLYKVMEAKRAEIAAIEERLNKQAHSLVQEQHIPMPSGPEMMSPDLAEGYDSDEEAAIRQRAEEDWDREAREREKWVEARRRKLEMESRGEGDYDADFQVATPVSHYSWRESYTSPAPVVVKRNTPQNFNAGRTRLSGGGEWEEFRVDEAPSGRRASVSHGHDRSYSGGSSGWPRDHYAK
ncbi:hypothetical protein H072_8996 [Dactylellina haptotyla CBS 200.50]|uniref:DUF7514 domain-containing protein n=1 Tax=Dactylellina haptotyla (strain CBS 200.50) TaxID=1284197 RepID=S8A8C6_DACHA|nr:hypothetical protein H072_8996 [Dactylellina haptotyla CBS 200.50]